MKKGRSTEDQMVKILREADQSTVAQVAKKHGVSEATIYAWRKRYGDLEVTDVRRLKRAGFTKHSRTTKPKAQL